MTLLPAGIDSGEWSVNGGQSEAPIILNPLLHESSHSLVTHGRGGNKRGGGGLDEGWGHPSRLVFGTIHLFFPQLT